MSLAISRSLGIVPRALLAPKPVLARAAVRAQSSVPVPPNRVLSPHLNIYKFRSNMTSSVVFRGTGIVMMAGMSTLSILYLFGSNKYSYYVYQLQQYPVLNGLVKFGVAFPLSYHFLGGLRHLAWDNVIGNNIAWNKQTAYGALAVSSVVGLGAMFVEFDE